MSQHYSEGGVLRLECLIELRISQFVLFELILLLKLDKQLSVERFEAAASQLAVPSPPRSSIPEFEGRGCPTELGGVP